MADYDKYTVGWICALPLEKAAAAAMLDKRHNSLEGPEGDPNAYTCGEVAGHNIVIACLPSGVYGKTSAAETASHMSRTFHNLQYRFMVGIGAGIPSDLMDIRLGDIVVSHPAGTSPGLVQYDLGKQLSTGFERIGSMNKPPQDLLTALSRYRALARVDGNPIPHILAEANTRRSRVPDEFCRPPRHHDRLFRADYEHPSPAKSCGTCDASQLIIRSERETPAPFVHYGLIASGDTLLRDSKKRDKLRDEEGAICVEMESAGLMQLDNFRCLVIRGICDYADSHKNDEWQPYAALVAAAFTKGLLRSIQPNNTISSILGRNWLEEVEAFNPRILKARILQEAGGLLKPSYEWILSHSTYQSWEMQLEVKVLWLHGDPGTGKTMLLLGIIEHLSKTRHQEPGTAEILAQGVLFLDR
ncbi:nucleoside phosphorylase domain-containing protein [Aspergillus pseudodeflectus]|uniref:Nucleoside phosphorylase domain-containing protein n=1 Tax=Aspergillus pseudodeflectus TaxID=176178 RepID=A0ABR4JG29_9EURO